MWTIVIIAAVLISYWWWPPKLQFAGRLVRTVQLISRRLRQVRRLSQIRPGRFFCLIDYHPNYSGQVRRMQVRAVTKPYRLAVEYKDANGYRAGDWVFQASELRFGADYYFQLDLMVIALTPYGLPNQAWAMAKTRAIFRRPMPWAYNPARAWQRLVQPNPDWSGWQSA